MMRYLYTAWFEDQFAEPDDQDREWPACIVIDAPGVAEAHSWGDHLARAFATRRMSELFLRSSIEAEGDNASRSTPVVSVGVEASDRELGW